MSRNEKTLIILTPGFPSTEEDTVCLPMQQSFIRTMKEIYPDLNVIILSLQYPYFKKTYKWFDTTVISFDGRNKGGLTRLSLRGKLNAILKKINSTNRVIGLLSFWCGECALVGKKFADKHNLKHYCWILGQDAKKINKYPQRIQSGAGELIALSNFLQDEFEKNHGIRPLHVISAAIDTKQFSDTLYERDIDILGAGSLIPLKQYEVFVELVAEIKREQPGIRATLIGNGPEKEKLQTLIKKSGLKTNIILAGELPHPEVLQLMQRAKVFLHTSSYEGFGVVCLEALYSGAYVISFVKPMNMEIEHWEIAGSPEEMKKKTLAILQDPLHAFKKIKVFEMKNTVKKIMALFPD